MAKKSILKKMQENILIIASLVIGLSSIGGGVTWVLNYYLTTEKFVAYKKEANEDLKKEVKRLERKLKWHKH